MRNDDRLELVHHLFAKVAAVRADQTALVAGSVTLTYGELSARAFRLAHRLRAAGAGPDAPVAVVADKGGADWIVAVLGVWASGAAYLPIDPDTPAARMERMIRGAAPVAVVGPPGPWDGLAPHRLPASTGDERALPGSPNALASSMPAVEMGADRLAYIIHTSGSTGEPKPVSVPHRALACVYRAWEECYELTPEPRTLLQGAGAAFDVHVGDIARALLSGGRLVLCPTHVLLDPPALHALIERESIDLMELTPSVWRLLVSWLEKTGQSLPSVRLAVSGGEQWTAAEYRRLRSVIGPLARIVNSYGVAEAAVDSTWHEVSDDTLDGDLVPIGKPFPDTTALVLGEDLAPVPPGVPGELFLAGDGLARGYLGRPAATAERFVPLTGGAAGQRMYRTGDLVRLRPDGVLVHLGRLDDEVKVRGVRFQLGSVEAVLARHPQVRAVAVARASRSDRHMLIAHVVPTSPAAGLAERLRRFAARELPGAMVPAEVVITSSLWLTPAGKLDRRALLPTPAQEAPDGGHGADARPGTAPAGRTATEEAVIRAWTEVLGSPPTGLEEDFFQAGGDSLAAAWLALALRNACGADASAAAVYGAPTVVELARHLDGLPPADPVTPASGHRLSPHQRRLWTVHRLNPGDPSYNLPTLLRLRGRLREDVLRQALDLLVARHDALRTRFADGAEELETHLETEVTVPLHVIEAPEGGPDPVEAAVLRPFDLSAAPLCRATLVRRAPDEHDLVFVAHHVAFDGWSERILVRELGEIYSALATGARTVPEPVRRSYADFAAWQNRRLHDGHGQAARDYWRSTLASPPALLDLPAPPQQSRAGLAGRTTRDLGADLSDQVRAVARAHGATPYAALLAALATLLSRWSGQDDLVIGGPFGDRDRPENADLVGFCVSTLPLRLAVPGEAAFSEVLRAARRTVAEAIAHADAPFDQIVADLGLAGGGGRNPLFRVWLNLLGRPVEPPSMAGLEVEVAAPPLPGALFDLGIYVTDRAEGYRLEAVYDRGRLDSAHVAELLEQLSLLLAAACASPEAPLAAHDLRTGPAAEILPKGVADLRDDVPELLPALWRRGGEQPSAPAVRDRDGVLTFADLYAAAAAWTRTLTAAGTGQDQVVAVHGARVSGLVPALLGTLATGARFTVLDSDHPRSRLTEQLAAAGVRLGAELTGTPATALPGPDVRWIAAPDSAARKITDPGPDGPGTPLPDTASYVAFTSGTTGVPRGISAGTRPLAHFLDWYVRRYRLGRHDRFALVSGIAHDPLLRDILAPLWAGATLCVPPAELMRDPAALRGWLRDEGVTVLHVTPALCRMLALPERAPVPERIRLVCCAGDSLSGRDLLDIASWAPSAQIVNGYGATETPQLAGAYDVRPGDAALERVPVGSGIPGFELLVLRPGGRPAGIGERGEIVVRSPYLALGYLRDEGGFHADPIPGHRRFATGDLGRYGPDGLVTVLGRSDDQVKVRGHRVELGEVDARLRECPGVKDAAGAVRVGADGETRIVAYVVPAAASQPVSDVRERLRRTLPDHMLPSSVVAVERIPLTLNGKVDRAALAVMAPLPQPARPREATTGLERLVVSIWQDVLGAEHVPLRQNFFDLGADSMSMIRVHVALERELDRRIPPTALFAHPTVHDLAAFLASGEVTPDDVTPSRAELGELRARRLAARDAVVPKKGRA
ncbi:amino acid adenylation domain-containing protein [Nonomuraea purpurea]|uniref:Amino acid adenylation domain-containing protein n=1 Tax=Nonomuraea purpurea TaxID=1849276 RepID=A0ABV8GSE0_9ACTN